MNEREVVTIVELNQEDIIQRRNLKMLILAMTKKDPKNRIDIKELVARLNGELL